MAVRPMSCENSCRLSRAPYGAKLGFRAGKVSENELAMLGPWNDDFTQT